MPYLQSETLNNLFLKRLFAKGKLSVTEMVEHCIKNKIYHSTGMAYRDWDNYLENYSHLYGWILTELLYGWWYKDDPRNLPGQQLVPVFRNALEELTFMELQKGYITWDCTEKQRATLEGIQWAFAPTWRKRYKEIPVCKGMDL